MAPVACEPQYDTLEQRLSATPVITVPTITIASHFDGPAIDGTSYRNTFSGKYSHRILAGIGHNVPQEAPQEFANAVTDRPGVDLVTLPQRTVSSHLRLPTDDNDRLLCRRVGNEALGETNCRAVTVRQFVNGQVSASCM